MLSLDNDKNGKCKILCTKLSVQPRFTLINNMLSALQIWFNIFSNINTAKLRFFIIRYLITKLQLLRFLETSESCSLFTIDTRHCYQLTSNDL